MKRFILYSLSATMAVAFGTVARAAETATMEEARRDSNLLAQSIDESYGSEGEVHQFEYRSPDLVGGVLAPNDQGPNNRAVPTTYESDVAREERYGGRMQMNNQMDQQEYPTEGTILAPDDQDPYNRAEPTPNRIDQNRQDRMQTPGRVDQNQQNRMQMNNQMDEQEYPTEGTILAPDDQDPYNRANPTPNR